MKRLIISVILTLVLLMVPASGVLAATDTVEVTATPGYVSISNAPDTWTLNGIDGNGVIDPDTTYYANPAGTDDITPPSATVLDTECYFTITRCGCKGRHQRWLSKTVVRFINKLNNFL